MAVGMPLDAPGDERDALGNKQRADAVLHHLARALECGEAGVERPALAPLWTMRDAQAIAKLLRVQRLARALELAQDLAAVIVGRRCAALGARPAAQRSPTWTFLRHLFFRLKSLPLPRWRNW